MEITKTSLPEWAVGNGTVDDVTAEKVTGVGHLCRNGVRVKADVDNAGVLYVGKADVSASNGYVLKAGESEVFAVEDSDQLYVIASEAAQAYSYFRQ
jgi:hypothetical protein